MLKRRLQLFGRKTKAQALFRVFDCYDDEIVELDNGLYECFVWGYCAWSVHSSMMGSDSVEISYYHQCKEEHKDIFMGTNLIEQSRDCVIEVFSEEPGCEFSEHYIFDHSECKCDTCIEIQQGGYDENGNPTTDIDWETYEDEYLIFNDNREGIDETFKWTI